MVDSGYSNVLTGEVPPQLEESYLALRTYWCPLTRGDISAVSALKIMDKINIDSLGYRPALAFYMLLHCEEAAKEWNRDDPSDAERVFSQCVDKNLLAMRMLRYKEQAQFGDKSAEETRDLMRDVRRNRYTDAPSDSEFIQVFRTLDKQSWKKADHFWEAIRRKFPEWSGEDGGPISIGRLRNRASELDLRRARK